MHDYMIESNKPLQKALTELKYASFEKRYISLKMKYYKKLFNKALRKHNRKFCRAYLA
jgi:hypothetical protein|tara:strand:- start:691 stop:864 length:174 start_codon:yes stop_codon:yes gene_type:complete